MIQAMRQHKPERGRRCTTLASKRSFVPEELRIQHRPAKIEYRQVPGRWEGDFIKGVYKRPVVGVLSEHKALLVILCKKNGRMAEEAL